MTNYEYMTTIGPSKLAHYLRTTLASNQGCPPASLNQVFTMCHESGSCDQCWWTWLCCDRKEPYQPEKQQVSVFRCWDCKWGARGDGARGWVACMNPKFYGEIMNPDDYCSHSDERYRPSKEINALEASSRALIRAGRLTEEEKKDIEEYVANEKRKAELKLLQAELKRREEQKKKEVSDGGDDGAGNDGA